MAHDDMVAFAKIERTLWYDAEDGRVKLAQVDLLSRAEPLVILGEAGMGKSHLLEWLAAFPGYRRCTARALINRYDPRTLLGDAKILVIDALDEVGVQREGDAVDLVLRQLGALGYPSFVLSCRVADWRSATGIEGIREQYAQRPLELHLTPFDDDDVILFLGSRLGADGAKSVIDHFNARSLHGLLGNPQTLELIARVAGNGPLPETRSQLFERAIEVLRVEHRDTKASDQVAREAGIDAAGAAFAGLILTGNDAIVRAAEANGTNGGLPIADIRRLQGAEAIGAMLGTRLFKANGADRFSYWHRRIGEFLGSRWLSKQANTERKRRRLLASFHNYGLVPASLRGIHAWLAQDPALAQAVITFDPMGVIEYGDADNLTVQEGRWLLGALEQLAANNPRFNGWSVHSVNGIMQSELLDEVKRLITDRDVPFSLQFLVLSAAKQSRIVQDLTKELQELILEPKQPFAIRRVAAEGLVGLKSVEDWTNIVRVLFGYGDDGSIRLVIELAEKIGFQSFSNDLIVDLVFAQSKGASRIVGVLWGFGECLPESRIEDVLDHFTEAIISLDAPLEHPENIELNDFAYHLIARCVAISDVAASKLWAWLKVFDVSIGYHREHHRELDEFIRRNDHLRREIQRIALLDEVGDLNLWQRSWRLGRRLQSLAPTPGDVVALLEVLDPTDLADDRWRHVIQLTNHDGEVGAEVRTAARAFAINRDDLLEWIDDLSVPSIPDWKIEEDERTRKREEEKMNERAKHRQSFASHIDEMRAGDWGALLNPARAYLNLFRDIGEDLPAHERISQWLGRELADAAHSGFEAFLKISPPEPTARQISESFAQGERWNAEDIIVAGFAERLRSGCGFQGLSDERLMACLFVLRHGKVDDHAGIDGLEEAVEREVHERGIWNEAMRLYHEPQLEARCDHVDGLSTFMRDDVHATISVDLALEWLKNFRDMPSGPERELVNRLLRSGRFDELRDVADSRIDLTDDERRRNWDAIGVITSFDSTLMRFQEYGIEPELIWHLSRYTGGRFSDDANVALGADRLEWIIDSFRSLWPLVGYPSRGFSGDRNAWDASNYLVHLISGLGNDSSSASIASLKRLLEAPDDSYTETIKGVAAEQERIRVETMYKPLTLEAVDAIVRNIAPVTIADLQAFMVEELKVVQAKIKSDDVDSWRGFYDDKGVPYEEERCRDHLLGLLRQGSERVRLDPETHVGGDKEVDITCAVGELRIPIEIKGQWHSELWRGADAQLDRLYTVDWRAGGCGIYLVLWFGDRQEPNKRLSSPGRAACRPGTAEELRQSLIAVSAAARYGRVVVFVLDLDRSRTCSF